MASSDSPTALASSNKTGPRGIPEAIYIEDVEAHVAGSEAESVIAAWREMIQKYQYMEKSTIQKKLDLEQKIPELATSLETVQLLKSKKDANEVLETHFELTDTLYTSAIVEPVNDVYLWLGAHTMMAYSLSEAHELLSTKIESAKTRLGQAAEEHAFLKDQITTSQVNLARVHNWNFKRRSERRLREEEEVSGRSITAIAE